MKPFLVSPDAADDLTDIWFNLAEHSGEKFADTTMRRFVRAFAELADLSGKGHRRSDVTRRPVHFFFVDPYFVIYHRDRTPLEIYAVIHGSRDLTTELRKRT